MFTICFTGHRPNNQNMGGYNWNSRKNKRIIKELERTINDVVDSCGDNLITFICGGALGTDQMAFSIVENLRNTSAKAIFIELASPFKDQDCKWNQEDVDVFQHQLKVADIVTFVDTVPEYQIKAFKPDIYYPLKMQKRNEYMVDKSDTIIAVYDGSRTGGTHNCVEYAKSKGKNIVVIDPTNI